MPPPKHRTRREAGRANHRNLHYHGWRGLLALPLHRKVGFQMKRFFCVTCKCVRRVRTLPDSVATMAGRDEQPPEHRLGRCFYHESGFSRAQANDRRSLLPRPTRVVRAHAPVESKPAKKQKQSRAKA
jgi:hypothetical protein